MKISESDFEDWVCEHLDEVVGKENVRLVGRQLNVPGAGTLDVLAYRKDEYGLHYFYVLELKAESAGSKAAAQCIRYVGALKAVIPKGRGHLLELAYVEGWLVAPRLSANGGHVVNGSNCLSFCKLEVGITAQPWDGVSHSGLDDDRAQMKEFLESIIVSEGADESTEPVAE